MDEAVDPIVEITRDVMNRVAAGVEVVTMVDPEGGLHGMTISSLAPISYEPPSVAMCVGHFADMQPLFVVGQAFCVNVLAADQVDLSNAFAYGTEDPFEVSDWSPTSDGTPVLSGTTATLMCEVENVVMHDSTAVVMSKVISGEVHKDETLVYWTQRYFGGLVPAAPEVKGSW